MGASGSSSSAESAANAQPPPTSATSTGTIEVPEPTAESTALPTTALPTIVRLGRLRAAWQAQREQTRPERAASAVSAPAAPVTVAAPSDHLEPALLPRAALEDWPAQRRLPELLRTITPKDLGSE